MNRKIRYSVYMWTHFCLLTLTVRALFLPSLVGFLSSLSDFTVCFAFLWETHQSFFWDTRQSFSFFCLCFSWKVPKYSHYRIGPTLLLWCCAQHNIVSISVITSLCVFCVLYMVPIPCSMLRCVGAFLHACEVFFAHKYIWQHWWLDCINSAMLPQCHLHLSTINHCNIT